MVIEFLSPLIVVQTILSNLHCLLHYHHSQFRSHNLAAHLKWLPSQWQLILPMLSNSWTVILFRHLATSHFPHTGLTVAYHNKSVTRNNNSWHNSNGIKKLFVFLHLLPYQIFPAQGPMGKGCDFDSVCVKYRFCLEDTDQSASLVVCCQCSTQSCEYSR